MPNLRVVVAPDSFKGSAGAAVIASAVARGWLRVRPDDVLIEAPLADGGEGTLDAFEAAVPGSVRRETDVPGPDDRIVRAPWLLLPDGTAVVELAAASGLVLLEAPRPYDAHTRGLGRVIVAALDAGATRVVIGLGGSASTDGGAGLLVELGARLLDSVGDAVPDGAHGLTAAVRIDLSGLRALPPRGVTVLADVRNPLVGPRGAAAVYGPQKGATGDDVLALDEGLRRFAQLVDVDPETPGAGAAGGTGFGLLVWGAALVPGAEVVADLVDLPSLMTRADVVVTGEGRLDEQTAEGKVVSVVASIAGRADVPVLVVAGSIADGVADQSAAIALSELAGGAEESIAHPELWAERAGAALAVHMITRGVRGELSSEAERGEAAGGLVDDLGSLAEREADE
ncbi:glycerate kinase [Frigoribacterium sp. CFBP 13712]|uniref:glycerate kinase n=1 Tax=Frigoribacterium sp. CFBP 13712 TaxID=2775309 RepID=UPI001782575F|nr:glycerate kinase [Frigoribacterium sp. CFBP 13712]MBD8703093.1 glycerate kinase [Frigoribacterium sp. CFBP 13712]